MPREGLYIQVFRVLFLGYLLRYFVGLSAMSAAAIRFSSEHLHKSNTKLQAEVLTSPIKYGVVVDSDTAVSWRKIRYLVSETT